ncbi:DUF1013 domain-containing protein [Parvularcula flava]|uniref:DUF1013 domain-containing protein n=1 Tax=Aquisalinus luteolus TaxID=1566827 RepID=A0A8J3EQA0_9PROT|nr:cell cycle transcriptional regulator TrcR [Aquisalinus luteolus]NHK26738.1 DUF1013 domain-containing protein [Aquisalinus luteolus]GGH93264.1 hypothetical protein GCM10011355_04690 [Aquisalinus luteolus]
MSDTPLMPKATAVWLIDNTSLSFDQIAAFCGLHPLEVKGIADGDVAGGVRGIDPVSANQLTREEIEKGEADTKYRLKLSRPKTVVPNKSKKSPRYTPVSKRQNRPDAIAWMVRNHPEVSDAQIGKLLGTTKATIQSVRDRTHWNSANLTPQDPVGLGLCSQIDLDMVVKKAASKKARMDEANGVVPEDETLKPADETVQYEPEEREKKIDPSQVFANFTGSSKDDDDEDDDNY